MLVAAPLALTWRIEGHRSAWMAGKEGSIVRMEWATVAELEFSVCCKVGESGPVV